MWGRGILAHHIPTILRKRDGGMLLGAYQQHVTKVTGGGVNGVSGPRMHPFWHGAVFG